MKVVVDIDAEMDLLNARKAKLLKLVDLRKEVARLERECLTGNDSKLVIKIITEEVCAAFRVEFGSIFSRCREEQICTPRHVVFYLSRTLNHIPFMQIGRTFGRDHGAVIHGCNKMRDRMSTEPGLARQVQDLSEVCKRKIAEAIK